MSIVQEKDHPRISGLNYLVESVLNTDDHASVMRIGAEKSLGKTYAMKVVKREEPEDQIYIDLARACYESSAKLSHPAILAYHDFQTKRSWFRIARADLLMEYVDGKSLDKMEGLEVGALVLIFREVATAMAHMHRRGVRHGDLKPSNVMLAKSGEVKVLGYGRSAIEDKSRLNGTWTNAAPEQVKSFTIDDRTDIYTLGATMYHALTGRRANVGKRAKGEVEKIPTPETLNPSIPSSLNALVITCLQSNPAKRPESMFDIQQALDPIARELGAEASQLKGLTLRRQD